MANQGHVDILKQGAIVWNRWRQDNPRVRPDLSEANLSRIDLIGANLIGADLSEADLSEANLSKANLNGANLNEANLSGTNFSNVRIESTVFADVDLSTVKGLETVIHDGPSTIGIDTIIASRGKIPEIFLRGAGVPDTIIDYIPSLIGALQPIDYYTCFISHSSQDQEFAKRLYADLQKERVRCWYAPENLKIGDKFWHNIDTSIRLHDKLLIVLSESSITSELVEREITTALRKEKEQKKLVLFPIRLDEAVMQSQVGWAAYLKDTRHIGNFTKREQPEEYQKAFQRLLRDLKAEASK
jgi:hypothetical protein